MSKKFVSQTPLKPYTSNSLVECVVNEKNVIQTRALFAKAIPLLDPIHYLLNNYCISHHPGPSATFQLQFQYDIQD